MERSETITGAVFRTHSVSVEIPVGFSAPPPIRTEKTIAAEKDADSAVLAVEKNRAAIIASVKQERGLLRRRDALAFEEASKQADNSKDIAATDKEIAREKAEREKLERQHHHLERIARERVAALGAAEFEVTRLWDRTFHAEVIAAQETTKALVTQVIEMLNDASRKCGDFRPPFGGPDNEWHRKYAKDFVAGDAGRVLGNRITLAGLPTSQQSREFELSPHQGVVGFGYSRIED